ALAPLGPRGMASAASPLDHGARIEHATFADIVAQSVPAPNQPRLTGIKQTGLIQAYRREFIKNAASAADRDDPTKDATARTRLAHPARSRRGVDSLS